MMQKGAVKDNQASLCFYDICKACEYFDCASCGCGALFESRRDEFAEQPLISAREKSANAARQKNISRTDVPVHQSIILDPKIFMKFRE